MNAEVERLFAELLDAGTQERSRYYAAHAVAEDVRQEVESLLGFDGGPPLDQVVRAAVGVAFEEAPAERAECGPFRLLRVIGRGGMGVVWLAERVDGEVRQQVAVKLLRAALDSPSARQHFLQERQILASLDHPNIARLIDAGRRHDGQPWLAMELVEGRRIDEHCQDAPVRECVSLMAQVCDAIASAHQKLVVHRDLKPGNIIVDANGSPRVLDFGIAKLIDDSDETATMERRLTPEFASPEQIAGAPVSTATDIYSLGAVLARLLGKAADKDLRAIIARAMRVEPRARYSTAVEMAEDLRAWLDGDPVDARRGETWYLVRRRLQRYWLPVTAGVIAASGLVTGMVATRIERDRAQERFEQVRKLANEFFAVEKDIQALPGSTPIRERMVRTSLNYLEELARRTGDDWHLKADIAAGYRHAAEAQGLTRGMNLGKPAEAKRSLGRAAALMAEVRAAAPEDRSVLRQSIELTELQLRVDYEDADMTAIRTRIGELHQLLQTFEAGLTNEGAEWLFVGKQYEALSVMASRQLGAKDMPLAFARKAVECQQRSVALDRNYRARGSLANAMCAYANLLRAVGDLHGSLAQFDSCRQILERMAAENPDHYTTLLNLANTYSSIGRVQSDAAGPSLLRTADAVRSFDASLRIGRRLMELDPAERQARSNHAIALWRLAGLLAERDPAAALAHYDEAAAIVRALDRRLFSRNIVLAASLADSTLALRALHREKEIPGRLKEAWSVCEMYRGNAAPFETCVRYPSHAEAVIAMMQGHPDEAARLHRLWIDALDPATREADARGDSMSGWAYAESLRQLARALTKDGRPEEARRVEGQRAALLDAWRPKLSGRNTLAMVLGGEAR
jgi:tRNA A-37 threonylcarbamoyl transferase component Bud32